MAVQINVAANQAALVASIQAGVQAYNQRFAQNNQLNLQINARAFSQPLGRITGDVKDFEAALAASNARVIAFGASTAVLGGVIRSFKELASVTIEVEKNLADINRVFGLTTSQLQKFSTDLFNVTKQTASSFNDASKAALEFSRQGLKAEDTLQRTKDALTLTRLAGISTANAVDALTSTVNGFAATGVTTSQILNKLVAVEQDFAVGAGDLAEALSRTGQAAQEAGVSLDQLNALVTSAQQSTARGGAVIGNALKTIFTRLQRTETLDQLEAFNISVRDVQGNILPAVTILQNFAGAYKNLADAQRAQLSEQVAGVYQVNILKAIVNDLNKSQGVYAGALQRGASATNEAEIATAKLNKTLDALLSQTATSAQQLANNIGKVTFEPLARYGTEQLKSLVESMNEILEGEGIGSTFANGLLKGIRNVIAGPGAIAAFFTLFKLIQNSFTYLSQALPQIAGITTETQNRKNIEQSILQIMQQQGPISQALAGTMGNQAAQAQLLLQLARQQTAEYQQQSALAKQLAAQLSGQGVRVKGSAGLQVTRAGGYVPTATKLAEVVGAQAGGYSPGRVVPSPVGGVMNTAEDVKYIPGFAQPFINPPANSKAGRTHRQNAINRTGVDPYMANGFVPNFAKNIPIKNLYKQKTKSAGDLIDLYDFRKPTDLYVDPEYKIERIPLPLTSQQYDNQANDYINQSLKSGINISKLKYKNIELSKFLSDKFDPTNLSSTDKNIRRGNLNNIKGALGEIDTFNILKYGYGETKKLANKFGIDFEVKSADDELISLIETKTNKKLVPDEVVIAKALTYLGRNNNYKNNSSIADVVNLPSQLALFQPKGLKTNSLGFIPNFAPPTSAIRVPWFRKFGNPSFDAIQPTLGISRASDTDTFRSSQFRSKAFEKAATDGDPNLFAPLYEDFIFKALQLVSQPKIKDQLIRGYVNQPGTDQKQSAFDAFLGDVGLEFKGFPKENLTGSISKNLNDKYERYAKANPTGAAKIKESIIAFNEIGDKNQLPSDFGKNFIQLAGTSYSEMVKNNPDLVKGLSAETNMLLSRYVKNPAFLAMASSHGFIPNFAYKQAVMGLEESMSGNKAIFDTKPFPHIRNSSQPTFSSAIADHGGLANAMSDSMRGQKAAGLMSKGFVPNFAQFGPSYSYMPSGAPSGASSYYPSGNPNKPQAVSPTYQAPAAATNTSFQQNDIDKALQDFINSVQAADQKLGIFESTFGGRTKIIDSELGKLKNTLSKGGVSGSKLNEALDSASKKINNEQSKLGKALEKSSTTLAIAGPLIAGQLEQLFFANKKRTELSETERAVQSGLSTGLTSISTGASIGAAFGPLGAGIGAATGALIGLTSALSATKLSAEELTDLNQEQVQKSQASISAASSYIEAQKSLTQMIASGASSSDIENATKKLSLGFNEIADVKLQEIFNATGGDVKKMTEELQKYSNEISRRSAFQKGVIEKSDVKTTVQALSIGVPKQSRKDVVEGFRKAALFSQSEMQYEQAIKQAEYGSNRKNNEGKTYKEIIDEAEKYRKENINFGLENFIPKLLDIGGIAKDDPQYKSEFENALKKFKSLPPEKLKEIADSLEKADLVSGVSQSINKLDNVATKSFNQIFLEIEQRIAKTAFDISLNFERDSGQRRIQSAILDFSMNFQDSINSFLSNNLPDARKFDFTAATAGQKAEMLLQKSQQDYDKAIAEQANERSIFLNKTTKDLTESFKSSFLPSQTSAQFFEKNILSQLESGTFTGDARSLAKQMQTQAFTEAQEPIKAAGFELTDVNKIDDVLKGITGKMEAISTSAGVTSNEYVKLESALKAIKELQKQTALYTNDNEVKKLQGAINASAREQELFDLKQANAKKELEINKQLSEARIAVDRDIAIAKAKVDKENMMRTEQVKDLTAQIGNNLEIAKARSTAQANAIQRRLEDPRQTYGMGVSQISERKFAMQADILKIQRDAEDRAINAEIQQRMLEMAAEQENTAATLKLNDTIMTLIETQLRGALGGQQRIEEISATAKRMGAFAPANIDKKYGAGTFAQFQALQRIQESRVASAANNTGYNTSTFETNMKARGFNDTMSQAEQLKFLEQEETKARNAGNLVLAGTIKRYQDQIAAKKQALKITREDIDAQIKLNTEIERVNNTFNGRFRKGFGNLVKESDELLLNLGENLPKMFADGLVDGIKAAIRESDNLGEALMGIASKFLDSISTTLMQSAVYGILGNIGVPNLPGIGAKQRGGVIRAQSGMYISGTGSGDKYPALLENGEYVLNRKAVMAMGGPAELDKLNFSMAPRFASGGSFSNKFEDIGSMESNMTTFGLEESKLYNELRDVKRQEADAARQKKRARRQQMAGIIGSLAGAAVSLGISAGVNKYKNPTTPQKIGEDYGNLALKTDFSGSPFKKQVGGSIGSRLSDTIPAYATGGLFETPIVKRYALGGQTTGIGFGGAAGNNSTVNNNTNANNSFSFNTTVQRDGKIQVGANTTSYAQQDVELSQNLNNKVYEVVLDTIRKEKRFGGSLAGARNS